MDAFLLFYLHPTFTEYEMLNDTDIPEDVWRKATLVEEEGGSTYHRKEIIWHYLSP